MSEYSKIETLYERDRVTFKVNPKAIRNRTYAFVARGSSGPARRRSNKPAMCCTGPQQQGLSRLPPTSTGETVVAVTSQHPKRHAPSSDSPA